MPGNAEEVVKELSIHVWVFPTHLNKIVLETLEKEEREGKIDGEEGVSWERGSPDTWY